MRTVSGIFFLLFLLTLLAGSLYLLYLNFPGEFQQYSGIKAGENLEERIEYSTSKQFYNNMRFPDKKISYKIERICDSKKRAETTKAFSILSEETILEFYNSDSDTEITIFCSEIAPEAGTEDYFVAGEGGPTEVINTSIYAVIFKGKVSFFRDEKCDRPNIALHEILHALGFDHNNNPKSVLFPTLDCEQVIDQEIINDINNLYSVEKSPDLKIENLDGSKSGRYLNFEIQVVNQGLENAKKVFLKVYYNDELIKFEGNKEALSFEDINVGTTKILSVTNSKIPLISNAKARISEDIEEKIRFVVDEENLIDEIFEDNNEVELILD